MHTDTESEAITPDSSPLGRIMVFDDGGAEMAGSGYSGSCFEEVRGKAPVSAVGSSSAGLIQI